MQQGRISGSDRRYCNRTVMKQEKRKKKEVKKDVRIDRKLKNGQKV